MMNRIQILLLSFLIVALGSCAQESKPTDKSLTDYVGLWEGRETHPGSLNMDITIEVQGEEAIFMLANRNEILSQAFQLEESFRLSLDEGLSFRGRTNADQSVIEGFVGLKKDLYPTKLYKEGNSYKGKCNLSALQYLRKDHFLLQMKAVTEEEYSAYPMLGTFWASDFQMEGEAISFQDFKTGLGFKGKLKADEILLDIHIGSHVLTTVSYKPAEPSTTTAIPPSDDRWKISPTQLNLKKMEAAIYDQTLEGTEGVIVAQNGEIVYEQYFGGFAADIPHDIRSAGKSIGSAIIGLGVGRGIIEDVDQLLYPYIPPKYQYTSDSLKSQITLKGLLTMRSGIQVYEDTYQESDDWLKTALEAPLGHAPQTRTMYKSADPFLTGVYLNERIDMPMEFFIVDNLLAPLGITNYIMNTDDQGIPYFGGGIHLTPRDILAFGQLYLDKGRWKGQQVISEPWVKESMAQHTNLENVADKNGYGYFWWHHAYTVNGQEISSVEARGAGGQYIFILVELNAVVVITSGNYRNGKTRQPEQVLEDYILGELLK
ncbi:MAG: serine hydrolase [Bacteroidota bacterium]